MSVSRLSNALRYRDKLNWQVDDGKTNIVKEDEEVIEAAQRILQKKDLIPSDNMRLLRVSRSLAVVIGRNEGGGSMRTLDIAPIFQRSIGEVPVEGPGGKAVVFMNDRMDLIGFDRIWRRIECVHLDNVRLRSPKSALEDLRQNYSNYEGKIVVEEFQIRVLRAEQRRGTEVSAARLCSFLKDGNWQG